MGKRIFITDKEVASVCEISVKTLGRIIHGFYRGKRGKSPYSKSVSLVEAKPETIGGYRRWRITEVARVLKITPEELEKRIS